eukprot:jgi/Bigna1/81742/fgenesh1_pg.83_\
MAAALCWRTPILLHNVCMGPVADSSFMALLAIHLLANSLLLVFGPIALFSDRRSSWHRKAGYIFIYCMVASMTAGLGMIAIRTAIEGLSGSQGFSGAVNMYFMFIAFAGFDFIFQAILVGVWQMNSFLFTAIPTANMWGNSISTNILGAVVWFRFGILPEVVASDPQPWRMFEPIIALFAPVYMVFEAQNARFHLDSSVRWLLGQRAKRKSSEQYIVHHQINMKICLAIVFSIFLGDLCINRFWNLALAVPSFGGVRCVVFVAFALPLLIPLQEWIAPTANAENENNADFVPADALVTATYGSISDQKRTDIRRVYMYSDDRHEGRDDDDQLL